MQDFDGGGQKSYRINYKAKKKKQNARFKILNNTINYILQTVQTSQYYKLTYCYGGKNIKSYLEF